MTIVRRIIAGEFDNEPYFPLYTKADGRIQHNKKHCKTGG